MVAAPVLIMNLAVNNYLLSPSANDNIVEAPTFVFFPGLITDIPEAILNLAWVHISESILEAHAQKV